VAHGRIVRDVEEAVADMAERRGSLSGPLRISAPVTFGRMHLGPALFPFLARHPKLEMTLELDDRRVDAASEGFDAVIRHGPILDSRLVVWRIATSRRVLVASPDYLARAGVPTSIEQLRTHRGIFYTNRGIDDWRFEGPDGAVKVRARIGLRVNNGDLLRDAAVAGLGIAFLPTFIASDAIKANSLKVIDLGV
jgi:DNA-binding transcriptional LysR family regulator